MNITENTLETQSPILPLEINNLKISSSEPLKPQQMQSQLTNELKNNPIKSDSSPSKSSSIPTPNTTNTPNSKPNLKNMTKAERRELQERQRLEKALKNGTNVPKAQRKQSIGSNQTSPNVASSIPSISENIRHVIPASSSRSTPSDMRADDSKRRNKTEKVSGLLRTRAKKPVALLSHLIQYEKLDSLNLDYKLAGVIHPAILSLGLQFCEFIIVGGTARCVAMLLAFEKVISDYITPAGTSLPRNLTSYITKQAEFLNSTRPLATSMKAAIKYLKSAISNLSIDEADADAKSTLQETIYTFLLEKVDTASNYIIDQVIEKKVLKQDDVVLIYGYSSLVLKLLLVAKSKGMSFKVIVADGKPKLEGKKMVKRLSKEGIYCTYVLINAVPVIMKTVTKVFMGASTVFSNGAVMSRVGSSVVATLAHHFKIPVIILSSTIKFSESVRLDSFVWNEIGNSEDLVEATVEAPSERLSLAFPNPKPSEGSLSGWRDIDALKLLNIHYDVTPSKYITMVVCEHGLLPPESCLSVLREMESIASKTVLKKKKN